MPASIDADIERVLTHLKNEFAKLQTGRASPALVEDMRVSAYGASQPLRNVASVSTLDQQTLSISPWDKSLLRDIAGAITASGLGLNPQDNGETIMLKIPALTEERRRELVKYAKKLAEEAKVGIRSVRQDAIKQIKARETAKEIGEDAARDEETAIQKKIDETGKTIDDMTKKKEEEIMKV